MAIRLAEIEAVVTAETSDFDAGMDAAAGKLSDLEGKASSSGAGFGAASAAMAAGAVVIGAGLADAVSAAGNFEASMNNIGAVTGATASEMSQLSDVALQIGQDTAFSAQQGAAAITELGKAGIPIPDIMNGAAMATADLAGAGEIDMARAAEVMSNAMNTFGIAGTEAVNVADTLAAGANTSASSVNDLAMGMTQAGPAAAALGIPLEDTVATLAAFADRGMQGSDAGTSMKTMLSSLTPSTKAARAAFADLGLSTAETANVFFDANGEFVGMEQASNLLYDALKPLTDEQRAVALETLFGSDASRAAAILFDTQADAAAGAGKSLGDYISSVQPAGQATDVANAKMAGMNGALEALSGSIDTAKIAFGMALVPAIEMAAEALGVMVNAFIGLPEPIQQVLAPIAAVAAGLLAMGAAFAFIQGPLGAMLTGFKLLAPVIAGVSAPVLLVAAALAALYVAYQTNFLGFADGVNAAAAGLMDVFSNLILLVENVAAAFGEGGLGAALGVLSDAFTMAFQNIGTAVQTGLQGASDAIAGWVASAPAMLDGAWSAIQAGATVAWDAITATITNAWNAIGTAINADALTSAIGGAWTAIQTATSTAWAAIQLTVANAWSGLTTAITPETITTAVTGAWTAIQTATGTAWEAIKTTVATAWSGLTSAITPETLTTAVDAVWTTISAGVTTAWAGIQIAVGNAWSGLTTAITPETITTAVDGVWTAVSTGVGTAWEGIKSAVSAKWDEIAITLSNGETITTGTNAVWDSVKTAAETKWEEIKTAVSTKWGEIATEVGTKGEEIITAAETAWEGVRLAIDTKMQDVIGIVNAKWDEINTKVSTIGDAIVSTVQTKWGEVSTAVSTKMDEITSNITTQWDEIHTTISAKMDEIASSVTTKWSEIQTTIATTLDTIGTTVSTSWSEIQTTITTAMDAIGTTVDTAWSDIQSATTTALQTMTSAVGAQFDAITQTVSSKMSEAQTAIEGAWSAIQSATTTALQAITSAVSTQMEGIKTTIVEGIMVAKIAFINTLEAMATEAGTAMAAVKDTITGAFADAAGWLLQAGRDIMAGLAQGIREGLGAVLGEVEAAVGAITSALGAIQNINISMPGIDTSGFTGAVGNAVDTATNTLGNAGLPMGRAAANSMTETTTAAKNAIRAHSPSLVWMEIGQSMIDGVVIALEQGTPEVVRTTQSLADQLMVPISGIPTRAYQAGTDSVMALHDSMVASTPDAVAGAQAVTDPVELEFQTMHDTITQLVWDMVDQAWSGAKSASDAVKSISDDVTRTTDRANTSTPTTTTQRGDGPGGGREGTTRVRDGGRSSGGSNADGGSVTLGDVDAGANININVSGGREIERRALGGSVMAGRDYWVGEHGPELFRAGRGGSILSYRDSMAAVGGGTTIINNHYWNVKAEVQNGEQLERWVEQKARGIAVSSGRS